MLSTPNRRCRPIHAACAAYLVMLLSLTACAARRPPRDQPTHWQLKGAVTAVSDTTLEIRHKSGRLVRLSLDDRTTYRRGHEAADRQALRNGIRVSVDVESTPQGDRAQRVELF